MATFNGGHFIAEQVASILNQVRPPDELIISDDGSSDGTVEIVREVVADHPEVAVHLVVISGGERLGVTGNFERAIAATAGEIVVLSDQDDVWHRERISSVLPLFEADGKLEFVHSDAELVDEAGRPLGRGLLESLGITVSERALIAAGRSFEVFLRRNLATGAVSAFRRTLLERASPFPKAWVHDEWLAILAAAAGSSALVDERLVDYRQHGSNEIGVAERTLGYKLGRLFDPRLDRYSVLAERAAQLQRRLNSGYANGVLSLAQEKLEFESVRARYPRIRIARVPEVLHQTLLGRYGRLSSQGRLDIVRDLAQPS